MLFPPRGLLRNVADDKALVLRLTTGGVRTLFMSDAGFATEQWLIENEPDLAADILVKGWHSKDGGDGGALLARVRPRAVILGARSQGSSVGDINQYASQAARHGALVFRQDATGAVQGRLTSDGSFVIKGFLNQETKSLRVRDRR